MVHYNYYLSVSLFSRLTQTDSWVSQAQYGSLAKTQSKQVLYLSQKARGDCTTPVLDPA